MANLENRVKALEASQPGLRKNCFVGVMPGEDADQKVANYIKEHGEPPVGTILVTFVKPPDRRDSE